jgi:hypothetical protein
MKRVRSLRKNLLKMIFGEKFNEITNESESSQFTDKNNGLTQPHDPSLPFSAIYFLRNRLFQPSQSFDLSLNSPLPPLDMIFPGKKLSSQENLHIKSSLQLNSILSKRPRGEKRPIPENQKDEKYFERRKRNNEAAKKSRDARKMREDRVREKFENFGKFKVL